MTMTDKAIKTGQDSARRRQEEEVPQRALPRPLLDVKDLSVSFQTKNGRTKAVRQASFTVYPGQWVAIVGESGSGKSTSAMATLGLLPGTGRVEGGSIVFEGQEISHYTQKQFEKLRGVKMGLVPQDPMSNLWWPTTWTSPMNSGSNGRRS